MMTGKRAFRLPCLALVGLVLSGCWEVSFTDAEKAVIAGLSLSALPALPPDPTNTVADNPAAARLGEALFFDTRLSGNGKVACATCHLPDLQFQDGKPLGEAIGTTTRRTMPLAGIQWGAWFFWDGRKDSQWSQALGPLENPVEHGGDRTGYARFVGEAYKAEHEALFGPLPDLSRFPERASPLGDEAARAAWDRMPDADKDAVNRVFANIGKAIAAFERTIRHADTRFDRFAAALATGKPDGFTEEEREGLKLFIGKASCINCHDGPRFTDDHFHNTGVAAAPGLPDDMGRLAILAEIDADPFNCLGPYSDAPPEACGELKFMSRDPHTLDRAFKTPSLRGAASRAPYMHAGQIATLEDAVRHYNAAPQGPSGHSELVPLRLNNREIAAIVAFLRTLD